ncbi:Molybdenum cofactor guanylyltransferase [hydrothermal vent metagenome]|uniref:Molybdenum cofactor guanylyltransferase n=1 Tax=hydrothermal vent metagenome TaxID=652676 RepID=A0A3B1APE2_9ZZZZ
MHLNGIPTPTKGNTSGLILAGGRGQRFNNQDKGFIPFQGKTLAEHAIARLAPQVNTVLVSANRHLDDYQKLEATCVQDIFSDYPGPLAGVHAALKHTELDWLVSVACDTPCFPTDYVKKLSAALSQSSSLIAVAKSNSRLQNVFMLVHKTLFRSLDKFIRNGERKAQIWLEQHNPVIVDFNKPAHAFYNINTPEDLAEIEKLQCND